MLIFAHLGLTLALGRLFRHANPVMALLALGSMLPDIIDKPLGYITFGSAANGRIYAHTSLFLLMLMALAVYNSKMVWLAGGVLAHLCLDQMWSSPIVLLWPLLGAFPIHDPLSLGGYIWLLLTGLKSPSILIPEILGLAYLTYFAITSGLFLKALQDIDSDKNTSSGKTKNLFSKIWAICIKSR